MRIKIIGIILGFIATAFVYPQKTISYQYQDNSLQNKEQKKESSLHFLLSKDAFNPEDSIQRALAKDFLLNMAYFDIIIYDKEIENIYEKKDSLLKLDTTLYLESLKKKALLSYQKSHFLIASSEFQRYFNQYQSIYHVDTNYAFEYSKYSNCIQKTQPEKIYLATIDSAILRAHKRTDSINDLALSYMAIGSYFLFKRQLDTASYMIHHAEKLINSSLHKDEHLQSDLLFLFSKQEILNKNFELAVEYVDQGINQLLKTQPTDIELAHAYKLKAITLYYAKRSQEAIKIQKMAIYIFEKYFSDDHTYIKTALRFLALNYTSVLKYQDAINTYRRCLAIQKDSADFFLLRGLAEIYGRIDSLQQADEYFKLCLQYTIKATGEDSYQTSVSYHSYGQFLLEKMHEYSLGEQYLSKSIRIKYRIFNEAAKDIVNTLNILGTYYINSGQIERGLDSLQSSIIIVIKGFNNRDIYVNPDIKDFARQVSIPNTLAWKAYGLYLRYLQTNNLADLKASFRTYDKFALLAKEIRKYYQNSENMITSQEIYYVFEQAVDIGHMLYEKTGDSIYLDKIFTLIESKKSYTLFNSLNILEKKRLLQVPKTLLNTESNLQQQLGLINEKIDEEKSYRNNDSILRIFNKDAFKISMSLDSIRKIYKAKYSGFYQLKYGFKDMSLKEIQSKIPTNQAFLNYLVSDSLLSIMCITKNEVHLRCQQIDSSFFNPLRELIRLQKKVNTDNAYLEFHHFIKDSRLLYQYLIAPFDSVIKDKELVIIPDNILSYISFDALLTKDVDVRRPDYSRLPYLIKEHRTNVTNSMEIYFNMKARPKSKNQEIYAFAPSYPNTKDTAGLPKEYKFLRPLEYSNEEVRSIQQYFPTKLFLNETAKKDSFSIEAKHAKIIHLAMHTIIDNQKPMYSKLLFTYDSAVKNGVVNTYELLNMNLNADLAVLSGCSTGDGELQKGEGVMSLSTGFQYAGVPAIVMSLWEVNDKYGSLVIDDFYKYLARGLPKNQSLHQAKLDVLSNGNALYAHPFYWAGLTLMGDDSKIEFKEEKTSNYDLLYLPGIAILISLAWWYKRKKAA